MVVARDGRARRNGLAALAAAAMILVGGLALTSDGDDAPLPDAAEPDPSSSVATASPVPTTALVGEATGPMFGAPVGALVLLGIAEAEWRLLDPDTGVVRNVEELSGFAPDEIVPVRGGHHASAAVTRRRTARSAPRSRRSDDSGRLAGEVERGDDEPLAHVEPVGVGALDARVEVEDSAASSRCPLREVG